MSQWSSTLTWVSTIRAGDTLNPWSQICHLWRHFPIRAGGAIRIQTPSEPGGTWQNLDLAYGQHSTWNFFSAVHHCRSLTSTTVRRGGCSTEQRRTRRNNTSKELSLRFIPYSFDQRLSIAHEILSPWINLTFMNSHWIFDFLVTSPHLVSI